MAEKVQYMAEFGGAPINKDGIIKVKLVSPNSETGAVAKLLLKWGKMVKVTIASKKRESAGLEFQLVSIVFRKDETSQVVLEGDAGKLPVEEIVRYRGKALAVTVE